MLLSRRVTSLFDLRESSYSLFMNRSSGIEFNMIENEISDVLFIISIFLITRFLEYLTVYCAFDMDMYVCKILCYCYYYYFLDHLKHFLFWAQYVYRKMFPNTNIYDRWFLSNCFFQDVSYFYLWYILLLLHWQMRILQNALLYFCTVVYFLIVMCILLQNYCCFFLNR